MKWRQARIAEALDFGKTRVIQNLEVANPYSDDITLTTTFTDGTAIRIQHQSGYEISEVTWNPAMTWYEIGEPDDAK